MHRVPAPLGQVRHGGFDAEIALDPEIARGPRDGGIGLRLIARKAAGALFARRLALDQGASSGGILVGQQGGQGNVGEIRVAVIGLAIS